MLFSPSVETAVKIAKVLNVSVEYLVTGPSHTPPLPPHINESADSINKIRKYAATLEKLESIPEKSRNTILKLIDDVSSDCR